MPRDDGIEIPWLRRREFRRRTLLFVGVVVVCSLVSFRLGSTMNLKTLELSPRQAGSLALHGETEQQQSTGVGQLTAYSWELLDLLDEIVARGNHASEDATVLRRHIHERTR